MPVETVLGAVQMLQRLGVSNDEISDALLAGLPIAHNPSLKLADKLGIAFAERQAPA